MDKAVRFLLVFLFVFISAQKLVSAAPNLPDHVVLYFNFDEEGGNTISDLSKYKNEGEWIHIITVFDGNTVDYYVNGVRTTQLKAIGDPDVTRSPGLWLGAEAGAMNKQPVDVIIDEIWISKKALSENEIELFDPARLAAVTSKDKLAVTWGSIKAW
jgi:hypothetical protein